MVDFQPPFCANPGCPNHRPGKAPYREFISWGSFRTRISGRVPRFRCTRCGVTFSTQTFRVDYYVKKRLDYENIARRLSSCESLSAIGRAIDASTDSVSNRISRAARQALAFDSVMQSVMSPGEDLVADGFESFCVSQYFPNNIHTLVGQASQFVYTSDHVTLRRKGRMTEAQKARRAVLDEVFRPPSRAIERSFERIAADSMRVFAVSGRSSLTLWTDEKKEYLRAILSSPCTGVASSAGLFIHKTVSSRAPRTRLNPLFPVNYLDREIRKDLHEHVREGTCFGRSVSCQMERFSLYLFWHNYRKRHRARLPDTSHAEVAGLDVDFMRRHSAGIWEIRAWRSLTALGEDAYDTWVRARPTPLHRKPSYLPKYAAA